jgi:RimJ/RimL family protein N-acetyltransferase
MAACSFSQQGPEKEYQHGRKLVELNREDFAIVLPVFRKLDHQLVLHSVVEGNTPGKVWTDQRINSGVAVVWDLQGEVLIEGKEERLGWDLPLHRLLTEEIAPEAARRWVPRLSIYHPQSWEERLFEMLKGLSPVRISRVSFRFQEITTSSTELPSGCCLYPIDESLLIRDDLENINQVHGWVASFWSSFEKFLENGLGYALVREGQIVSWCLSVFRSGNQVEFGVETDKDHQKRGYARVVARACVEDCLSRGWTPRWQCDRGNLASIMVAKGVGFEKEREYSVLSFQPGMS